MQRLDHAGARKNFLLSQLPTSEFKRLAVHFELKTLELGDVLYETNTERDFVFFPVSGIVSILEMLQDGSSSEIALIGSEGMVGITAVLGGKYQPNRAVVQSAGMAYRIPAAVLSDAFRRGGVLMDAILLYIQAVYIQVAQMAVCNRHHNLQQQLTRWLLLSLDRMDTNEIALTQEQIASFLGVRREGVTRAARALQDQNIIEYRRGCITVVDRPRLEEICCECYNVVKNEAERLSSLTRTRGQAN